MSNEKESVNLGGRPTTTLSEFVERCEKATLYLMGGWKEVGDAIPSIAGLACYIGVSRETIYKWSKDNESFSDICRSVLTLQENTLLNNGLTGTFNAQITKLVLGKHSYSEKAEVDLSSNDGTMTPSPAVVISGKEVKEVLSKLNDEC